MTAIYNSRGFATAPGVFGQIYANTIGAMAAWNDARATRNALSQLSDRELDDIGLCRGDIEQVVRGL